MSRTISLLILLMVIVAAFLMLRNTKDSYKLLPDLNDKEAEVLAGDSTSEKGFENWHEFASPKGDFKVLLPVLPQHATDKITDPKTKEQRKYDMFVSAKDDGTVFMISMITFPAKIEPVNVESTLTSVVNDMLARNKENKLKMMQGGKFRDNDALDFSIENTDVSVTGKAFIKHDILYILSELTKDGKFNQTEFDFFVNSFDVSNPKN